MIVLLKPVKLKKMKKQLSRKCWLRICIQGVQNINKNGLIKEANTNPNDMKIKKNN